MSSLVEFLTARIAEAEGYAPRGHSSMCEWSRRGDRGATEADCDCGFEARRRFHLAECEAKRRIVEMHDGGSRRERRLTSDISLTNERGCGCGGRYPCPTLQLLALPYSDHPDYDEEWRP